MEVAFWPLLIVEWETWKEKIFVSEKITERANYIPPIMMLGARVQAHSFAKVVYRISQSFVQGCAGTPRTHLCGDSPHKSVWGSSHFPAHLCRVPAPARYLPFKITEMKITKPNIIKNSTSHSPTWMAEDVAFFQHKRSSSFAIILGFPRNDNTPLKKSST